MRNIIDAHIHFDMYSMKEQNQLLQELKRSNVDGLICVSNHLRSAQKVMALSRIDKRIKPAIGYHPEQELPTESELYELTNYTEKHQNKIVAIGEVGLPYYKRQTNPNLSIDPYVETLERFIELASQLHKPIVLHAIYDDAPLVCDLLEKYNLDRAHFHWFKGDIKTVERMIENGYSISITPDCLYEEEIQQLIKIYPLELMMVETDGPWPFEGPFHKKMTNPSMIHESIQKIASLKEESIDDTYHLLYQNTKEFYSV